MISTPNNLIPIIRQGETPNINRNVYVTRAHVETWETLKREHPGNYYKTYLVRSLYSLAITPGGRDNGAKTLEIDGAQFHYQILESGDVLVYGLRIDSSISTRVTDQATGLYRVRQEGKEWSTKQGREKTMVHDHHWGGVHYAAVSGKFEDKEEAGRLLINHILPAYERELHRHNFLSGEDYHYSLFWQNGEHHKETNAKALTALIQQAQAKDVPINWLVHGEGVGTFVQALKGLSSAPGIARKVANGNHLSKQSVFFSNPRGKNTSQEELKALCKSAQIDWAGIQINKHDYLLNKDARKGLLKSFAMPAALYALGGAGTATGWDDLSKGVGNIFTASNVVISAAIAVGAVYVATNMSTQFSALARNTFAGAKSTFGEGNKQWAA